MDFDVATIYYSAIQTIGTTTATTTGQFYFPAFLFFVFLVFGLLFAAGLILMIYTFKNKK